MYELKIKLGSEKYGEPELLRIILEGLGAPADKISESLKKSKTTLSIFIESYKKASLLKRKIYALRLRGISVLFNKLEDINWKTRWKKYFKPFDITPDIRIIPAWKQPPRIRNYRHHILIDTTFAFGTGLHPTTAMMARLIAKGRGKLNNFLDIGTGSGILCLVAGYYGAKQIWAIDNDKEAVKTALNNFRINNYKVKCLKTIDLASFNIRKTFDFVAANLVTKDLVSFKHRLKSLVSPGGYLAVSGIYSDNYNFFRKHFKSKGLICVRELKEKKWHALLFKKSGGN